MSREVDLNAVERLRDGLEKRPFAPYLRPEDRGPQYKEIEELPAEAERIIDQIQVSFQTYPLPVLRPKGFDYDYEDFRAATRGGPWTAVDGLLLLAATDVLFDLEREVFGYYLPAYMTNYLRSWPRVLWDIPPVALQHRFEMFVRHLDPTEGGTAVYVRMDRYQRQCVRDFVRFFYRCEVLKIGKSSLADSLATLAGLIEESLVTERDA